MLICLEFLINFYTNLFVFNFQTSIIRPASATRDGNAEFEPTSQLGDAEEVGGGEGGDEDAEEKPHAFVQQQPQQETLFEG